MRMKQLYFSFIRSYLNYAYIAWASTNKSNLSSLYRNQKHAISIIYDKDRFAHMKPLFKHAKALTVYEINLFQILSLGSFIKYVRSDFVILDPPPPMRVHIHFYPLLHYPLLHPLPLVRTCRYDFLKKI